MAQISNKRRAFCVVQFIEMPFEAIDDYVCVPYSWIKVRKSTDQRAVVVYPKDEDPFDTRDRAERKERYNDEWKSYMAMVKYESDSYRDAEFWIATRNDYGPLIEEDSKIKDKKLDEESRIAHQMYSQLNVPRKSIKRPALSEPKKQLDVKRPKLQISNNMREFCVVQFIEKPFEAIDDYVCVPNNWIIVRKSTDQRVIVAYPNDKHCFVTSVRVERKEEYNGKWRFYMAVLKYESDTFKDADIWIATRNDYGPLRIEEDSRIKDEQLKNLYQDLRIAAQHEKRLKTLICNNMRAFYVVRFIDMPFEGIDNYVCVPYTWLVVRKSTDQRVVVAYPKDEDPFDTKDLVKRKEEYNDEWRFYMAVVKYESDTYEDAEFWIATRNDYGPLIVEDSIINDEQRNKWDEELRIAKRIYHKQVKILENHCRDYQHGRNQRKYDNKRLKI